MHNTLIDLDSVEIVDDVVCILAWASDGTLRGCNIPIAELLERATVVVEAAPVARGFLGQLQ